jgi:NAD(P)-dependent dehydrogenase (short-subunit alcohol dehydrogenase family)
MVDQGRGKVINISSTIGLRGAPGNYIYCSAKGAVVQLTRTLALTVARDNIQVNAIAPGFFNTFPPDSQEAQRLFTPDKAKFIPVGRFGQPDEIGPLAVFLASSASDYITGEVFLIDGGLLAGGYAPTGYAPYIAIGED